jgi:hypothetical protein
MFTSRTKLDKAVIASIAAMLAFNVLILSQQLQSAPDFAQREAPAAQQA